MENYLFYLGGVNSRSAYHISHLEIFKDKINSGLTGSVINPVRLW